MAPKEKYKSQPRLTPETEKIISGTVISWPKTREEIWPELWEKAEKTIPIAKRDQTVRMKFIRYAAAASLLLLVGISSAMYFYKKTIDTSYTSGKITLPDHSSVILSEHSSLSYKPGLWMISRKVFLEGEGIFSVNKGGRFSVISVKGTTSVLGTRFKVHTRQNSYEVTCFSGKVKVMEYSRGNEAVIYGGQKAILEAKGYFIILHNKNEQPVMQSQSKSATIESELDVILSRPDENSRDFKYGNKDAVEANNRENAGQKETSESLKPEQENVPARKNPAELQQESTQPSTSIPVTTNEDTQEQEQKTSVTNSETPANRLRNSLTKEQISILEDQNLTREEKKKAFMNSLSAEQKKLLDEQNQERVRNSDKESGSETLREQQRNQLQEQIRTEKGKTEQQKTGKPDNIDNPKTENSDEKGNKSGR